MSLNDTKNRVQIIDPNHPHFAEHGVWTGELIKLLGKDMGKVKLDNCRHGVEACFVSPGQIARELRTPRNRTPRNTR